MVAAVLVLLASGVYEPVSDDAVHLRLAIGFEAILAVDVLLDETTGTGKGYDLALVDTDGDRKPDRKFTFEPWRTRPEYQRSVRNLSVEHEGATWELDLWRMPDDVAAEGASHADAAWTVQKGDVRLEFLNSDAHLYRSAAEATKGVALRLGPPFRIDAQTLSRGREVWLRLAVRDPGGGALYRPTLPRGNSCLKAMLFAGKRELLRFDPGYG